MQRVCKRIGMYGKKRTMHRICKKAKRRFFKITERDKEVIGLSLVITGILFMAGGEESARIEAISMLQGFYYIVAGFCIGCIGAKLMEGVEM